MSNRRRSRDKDECQRRLQPPGSLARQLHGEFEQTGFKKSVQKNVTVEVNAVVMLNSTLPDRRDTGDDRSNVRSATGGHYQHPTRAVVNERGGQATATEFPGYLSATTTATGRSIANRLGSVLLVATAQAWCP